MKEAQNCEAIQMMLYKKSKPFLVGTETFFG
jgi:hypothetical protein